jgi:peptidoglycan/LPS O-acetylase OafA/YrhL
LNAFLREEAQAGSHNPQFVLGLTGIRALAAMMVLLHHLFAVAGPRIIWVNIGEFSIKVHFLLTCAWMGANVFFVLSGFLLALPYVARSPAPVTFKQSAEFIWRRIRRVVPAYWFQIACLLAISTGLATWPDWQMVGAHLLFLQNFSERHAYALNGVYWTLPTEFGFYLLLPVLAWAAYRMRRDDSRSWVVLAMLLVAFSIAWRCIAFLGVADQPVGKRVFAMMQLPGLVDHFAIGILLAWGYVRAQQSGRPISGRLSDALTIFGLAGMVMVMAILELIYEQYWDGHPYLFVGYSLTAVCMGAFIVGTAGGGKVSRALFGNPLAVLLGLISYSLYLWHFPVLLWTNRLLDRMGVAGDRLWWLVAIAIPASIAFAALSYRWIERPFIARRRRALPGP